MSVLGHALHLLNPGALPARQLLRDEDDVANFPANFSGFKKRRGPEDYKKALRKNGAKSAASLARSPAMISAGFRAWDVVCGVTADALIAWLVQAFRKAVLLDGWKPTGADSLRPASSRALCELFACSIVRALETIIYNVPVESCQKSFKKSESLCKAINL